MNYIVLNGARSTSVKGLLIQSLPPITKPEIRTSVEQIDGRDGDIVTRLGYAAYNKELSIGLYGDYDIDDVIKYFDSSGEVVFSNEPDKYYRYEIVEQIDFERLIRFRTAKVKMHVQPFKYSAVEGVVTKTTSGGMITNHGNVISHPTITICGSGNVEMGLNGTNILNVTIPESGTITIDSDAIEAYNESGLQNRKVTGNMDFSFAVGSNTITWNGNVEKIEISKYSRWI